ncbi:MAG: hypothetical protein ACRD2H_11650 [Terriglobales bacterium]
MPTGLHGREVQHFVTMMASPRTMAQRVTTHQALFAGTVTILVPWPQPVPR